MIEIEVTESPKFIHLSEKKNGSNNKEDIVIPESVNETPSNNNEGNNNIVVNEVPTNNEVVVNTVKEVVAVPSTGKSIALTMLLGINSIAIGIYYIKKECR